MEHDNNLFSSDRGKLLLHRVLATQVNPRRKLSGFAGIYPSNCEHHFTVNKLSQQEDHGATRLQTGAFPGCPGTKCTAAMSR